MRILISLLLVATSSTAAFADSWSAGTASVNITPTKALWMSGYGGRDRPAEGKLTDLWAKALVLEDVEGDRAALLTLDLVGIHRDTTLKVCDCLLEKHNLNRSQIAINCSHTHTGPAVGQNLGPLHYLQLPEDHQRMLDEYESELIDRLVAVVGEALEKIEPCALTWGSGLCTVAVNRRENRATDVPALRVRGELRGPYDHDVPVLAVRNQDQQLKAILFGYACHATVLSFYQWSGDYPGFAQQELELRFPGVIAMFWAGCGADQNPLPRRSVELAQAYGNRLATSVAEVIDGTMRAVSPSLETQFDEVDLRLTDLPSLEEVEAVLDSSDKYERARAQYILQRVGEKKQLERTYPYPVASWNIGDEVRFVLLGGEVVVDYALRLKAAAEDRDKVHKTMVWVAGYSNDVMAYIPSRRVLREGGYEGGGSNKYYGLPGLWSPEIEESIVNGVLSQWESLR